MSETHPGSAAGGAVNQALVLARSRSEFIAEIAAFKRDYAARLGAFVVQDQQAGPGRPVLRPERGLMGKLRENHLDLLAMRNYTQELAGQQTNSFEFYAARSGPHTAGLMVLDMARPFVIVRGKGHVRCDDGIYLDVIAVNPFFDRVFPALWGKVLERAAAAQAPRKIYGSSLDSRLGFWTRLGFGMLGVNGEAGIEEREYILTMEIRGSGRAKL